MIEFTRRRTSLAVALLAAVIALALWSRVESQTVIRPSKNDRILRKLDVILANQKDLADRLIRIEARLGVAPPPGPAEGGR